MNDDFKVRIQHDKIIVTHAQGHEYTFFMPTSGDVVVSGHYRQAQNAANSAVLFLSDARRIANEALKKTRNI